VQAHGLELVGQELGLGRVDSETVHHIDTTFTCELRVNRAHTGTEHLLVDLLAEVLFRRVREDTATATPQRRGGHTGTSTARTLLAPRLLGRVLDLFTILLLAVTAASVSLVSNDDLVNEGFVVVTAEHFGRRGNAGADLTVVLEELEFHYMRSLSFGLDGRG